jgi:putative transposase
VFIDESGFMMAPFVRRTWAPRGRTPLFYQRTASHRKVSVIAALRFTPQQRRVRLYFRLHPDTNITGDLVRQFLRHLQYQIPGHIVLVWDRSKTHRGLVAQEFIDSSPRLHVFLLPPYAPELNPVEPVWGYLKMNALSNLAVLDLEELARISRYQSRLLQKNPGVLRSLAQNSPLFSCPI